ncbi:MAG: 50S ribosomal protein L19 [Mollicutes bacterium PWAP]|nr:50S ribosomal protein L19 [Mollicutes bacterium PWAP]
MRNKLLESVEKKVKRTDIPLLRVGMNIKVFVRIKEGSKERIQLFEGLIISIKGEGSSRNFTVRKISYGVGVERTFMFDSPLVSHIEIVRENKIRRAKLYYLRSRKGKSAKLKEIKK